MSRCKAVKFGWHRVARGSESECWPWTGCVNRWGYGACQVDGRQLNASRAAWLFANGEIAPGLMVCHRCDNPICCNPSHLYLGTQFDNMRDRKEREGYRSVPRGAKHPRHSAKLTPEMVMEARRLFSAGVSQSEIGRRWGIHSSAISRAVRGESWGHVA